jgi:hypothetical protein
MRYLCKFLFSTFLLLLLVLPFSHAQIFTNNTSDFVRVIGSGLYPEKGVSDTIYIYNESFEKGNLFTRTGSLTAYSPDRTPGWTFIWSSFNYTTKKFEIVDSVSASATNSITKSGLQTGGYQVRMHKDTLDTTFRAWIFINRLRYVLRKNSEGKVSTFYSNCSYALIGPYKEKEPLANPDSTYIHADYFFYVDSDGYNRFSTKPIVKWTRSDGGSITETTPQITLTDLPLENTVFTASYTDTFGNSATDKVGYDAIATKADFKSELWMVYPKEEFDSDTSNREGEAPLRVRFTNISKNGFKFKWIVKDSMFATCNFPVKPSKIPSSKDDSLFLYTFCYPKTYTVKLFSTGPGDICTDSLAKTIKVINSNFGTDELRFPTVFYPDYDNDTLRNFVFKYPNNKDWTSIRNLKLVIFNQWGKIFYTYNGPIEAGWKGWNGKKDNKGSDAAAGIYYYSYEVLGWGPLQSKSKEGGEIKNVDEEKPQRVTPKKGSGFVYLLRK